MPQVIEVVERYVIPDFPQIDLPAEDRTPLESNWHRAQINLLIDIVRQRWQDRYDFFAGGNMFIYYSLRQARDHDYRGPDFFVVKGIDSRHSREKWVVWEEDGRYPDVIVELMSPSTAKEDLGAKKDLYARTFHTPDYFCYDPGARQLWGWHLTDRGYYPLEVDTSGRMWSAELEAWIGPWEGMFQGEQAVWLRLFDADGWLWPTEAEAERQRAEAAESEIARLQAELHRLQTPRNGDAV